jgi:transcriptional regulator with XRE-family HTH domain
MTNPDARRPHQILGEQVRKHRQIQGLSRHKLAERCTSIGAELNHDAIDKIENGRRADVGVNEWLALASALGLTSPSLLLLPETNEQVAITRGRTLPAVKLWRWFAGQRNPYGQYVSVSTWLPYLAGDHTSVHHDVLNVVRQNQEQNNAD